MDREDPTWTILWFQLTFLTLVVTLGYLDVVTQTFDLLRPLALRKYC